MDVVIINGEIVPASSARAVAWAEQRQASQQAQHSQRAAKPDPLEDHNQLSPEEQARLLADYEAYRAFRSVEDGGSPSGALESLDLSDPAVQCMACCFCCLFLFTLVMFAWIFWLEVNVGVYGLKHHVPCDKPLAEYLLVNAIAGLVFLVINLWFFLWARRNEGRDFNDMDRFELVFILWLMFMMMLFAVVWIVLGNYWVFSSKTCQVSSKPFVPSPKALMYSVYDSAYIVVLISDWMLFFQALELCIRWCRHRRRNEARNPPGSPVAAGAAFNNLAFTPFGWAHWLGVARDGQGARNNNNNNRRDFPNV